MSTEKKTESSTTATTTTAKKTEKKEHVHTVKDLASFKAILADKTIKKVFVDCFATWCGPCQRIAPFVHDLAEKYPAVYFVKIDVDEASDVSQELGIEAMPTFKFFSEGKEVSKLLLVGADKTKLEENVKELIKM
eukprot:TRINITY_DN332_c0_g1_i1.p1 TRINITY_DN332_c0_g1~~TRINITY_DN332_c0_g1_i1.p1  ORF type:complete len:135 (+),score=24.18 TRINITY_DN332_c0_g1_i1:47-451(+)